MDGDVSHGLKWSAIAVVAVRVLQAIRSIVIARVVGPESVGSFAAAFAFVTLASLVAEFGLQSFLIQRGPNARADARVVGELALATGAIASLVLLIAARPIASFYDDGKIAGLVVALVLSVMLTSLSVVPNALLRAEFRFDAVARASILAELLACATGVALAIGGAGVWALVGAALTGQTVTFIALICARPVWDSGRPNSRSQTQRSALRFGLSLAGGSAVWAFALQGDNVTVGRVLGASSLGLYSFAYNYGILPGGLIGSTVSDVALAGFGRETSDDGRARLFVRLTKVGAVAAFPLVAIAIASAPAAIRLVLGQEWVGATRPLQVLLFVGLIRGLMPVEALLRSCGLVGTEFRVGLVAAPFTILAAYVGARISLVTAAILVGLVLTAGGLAATYIAIRAISLPAIDVLRAVAPTAAISTLWALPLVVAEVIVRSPDLVSLVLLAPACVGAALLSLRRWLPGEWQALTDIARSRAASSTA